MVKCYDSGVFVLHGREILAEGAEVQQKLDAAAGAPVTRESAKNGTIAYQIIDAHNHSQDDQLLKLKFDSLTAHDITYVGIIQTARASGMTQFPVPLVMTNCHNSLCAVGGTINEDDHKFALSAAQKYGGIYVPTNLAVIHSYNREMMAKPGNMILGSDSHTRYGALGTMAIGEGGGELAKQLLGRTYDLTRPEVVAIYLTGKPQPGVGPQDVALQIIGNVYNSGYVKNKVMEFIGDGVQHLSVDYRNGIDVMTTETTCLSSIWETDDQVREYYFIHGREGDYKALAPAAVVYYDGLVHVDLSAIKPTIAMPFHPSNIYTIEDFKANTADILHFVETEGRKQFDIPDLDLNLRSKLRNGDFYVEQGIIAGCSGGTFENLTDAADILRGKSIGNGSFTMSVYPGSQPINIELVKNGALETFMNAGVIVREAFCGPCFGAGDTPANQEFSIRHTTRNFPNREGSKPTDGQMSYVALMDARSIAATAMNGGKLTAATELEVAYTRPSYHFNKSIYDFRVYDGVGRPQPETELQMGPNIKDWPAMPALTEDLLLKVVTYITDPVTTTDELIPSGETSSYRSNPLRLAEFTLGRKDPEFVPKAKAIHKLEVARENGENPAELDAGLQAVYAKIQALDPAKPVDPKAIGIGSAVYAYMPGDGSAREQAASCQKVLGTWANFAKQYATKRYRSNLINWGMLPFEVSEVPEFGKEDYVYVPNLRTAVLAGQSEMTAYVIGEEVKSFTVKLGKLSKEEREVIAAGCLINYYKVQ